MGEELETAQKALLGVSLQRKQRNGQLLPVEVGQREDFVGLEK